MVRASSSPDGSLTMRRALRPKSIVEIHTHLAVQNVDELGVLPPETPPSAVGTTALPAGLRARAATGGVGARRPGCDGRPRRQSPRGRGKVAGGEGEAAGAGGGEETGKWQNIVALRQSRLVIGWWLCYRCRPVYFVVCRRRKIKKMLARPTGARQQAALCWLRLGLISDADFLSLSPFPESRLARSSSSLPRGKLRSRLLRTLLAEEGASAAMDTWPPPCTARLTPTTAARLISTAAVTAARVLISRTWGARVSAEVRKSHPCRSRSWFRIDPRHYPAIERERERAPSPCFARTPTMPCGAR